MTIDAFIVWLGDDPPDHQIREYLDTLLAAQREADAQVAESFVAAWDEDAHKLGVPTQGEAIAAAIRGAALSNGQAADGWRPSRSPSGGGLAKRHRVHRVWHPDLGLFDATPCYGMHEPWWVPRNGATKQESEPISMKDTFFQSLPPLPFVE